MSRRRGASLVISCGPWGGFYWSRKWCARLCLGWVAITYIPDDLDFLLEALFRLRDEGES